MAAIVVAASATVATTAAVPAVAALSSITAASVAVATSKAATATTSTAAAAAASETTMATAAHDIVGGVLEELLVCRVTSLITHEVKVELADGHLLSTRGERGHESIIVVAEASQHIGDNLG